MLCLAMPFFWSYLSHFILDFDVVKSKVGLLNPCNLSSYLANPPASLPEMPWLAMPFFWSYLSHFILDFDGVKSKVGLLNPCNLSNYLAGPPASLQEMLAIVFLVISQPLQVKF